MNDQNLEQGKHNAEMIVVQEESAVTQDILVNRKVGSSAPQHVVIGSNGHTKQLVGKPLKYDILVRGSS